MENKITLSLLHQYKKEQAEYRLQFGSSWPEPDAVFVGDLGHRWDISTPSQKYQKILKKYNLKPGPLYLLRHTAASILIMKNVDPRIVADRMGHSRTGTTLDIYSHVFQEANEAATATITHILEGARKKAKTIG